jgi:hypothetical protein
MSVLPAAAPVLSGVDSVLLAMTRDAVGTAVGVSAGPLDRPVGAARLNWFLYRITPAPAFLNMEPPQTGWTTRRGRPPLALTLHYLLSADPGELSATGNEIEVAHDALTRVMLVLHENSILGPQTVITAPPNRTVSDITSALDGLIEPLRITLDPVPLETVTGLWASGLKSLRVSVAYQVSLVIVPSPVPFDPGPPVLEPVVAVSPSVGPRVTAVVPRQAGFGRPVFLAVTGLGAQYTVDLSRSTGDPDDPTDGRPNPLTTHSTGPWRLSCTPVHGGLSVALPNAELVPGRRVVEVTNIASGLPAGIGSIALTVAPVVVSAGGALQAGQPVTLQAAHVLADGVVNFLGLAVAYTRLTPTSVRAVVPAGVAAHGGEDIPVSITSGTATGSPTNLAVAP